MYALIEISGKQYRATEGERIRVDHLDLEEGDVFDIDRVLLLRTNGQVKVGTPTVHGAMVRASVVGHGLGRKIVVFKFKPKERYKRTRGHRQAFTELEVEKIYQRAPRAKPAAAGKKKAPKKRAAKPSTAKPSAAKARAAAKKARTEATPLAELGLSTRVEGLLKDAGLGTVEKLVASLEESEEGLLGIAGFGPKALDEVWRQLKSKGFGE